VESIGTADLVLAITLGVMSAEGSPLQVFHAAPGSAPCKLAVVVRADRAGPVLAHLHAIIFIQLRQRTKP